MFHVKQLRMGCWSGLRQRILFRLAGKEGGERQCHQLKTIDGLFYAKTVEMQPQLVGAGLCSARQNAVNSFENLRRIRKQLPLWM
jgi:hypothetical protein